MIKSDTKNSDNVHKALIELQKLDDFCNNECNMICKVREKESKDKCIIKDFINFINR